MEGGEQGVGGRVVLAGFPSAGGGQDPAGAGVHGSAQPGGGPAGDGLQGDGAGELGLPVVLGQGAPSAGRLGRLEALVGVPVGLGGPLLLGAGTGGGLAIGEVLVGVVGGHAGVADVHSGAGPAGVDLGDLVVFGLAQRPAQARMRCELPRLMRVCRLSVRMWWTCRAQEPSMIRQTSPAVMAGWSGSAAVARL